MESANVRLARRWFEEVWNGRRAETVHELLTAESTCESEFGKLTGPEAFLERVHGPFLSAFPDLRITIKDTVAEGDRVVVMWTATATHDGEGLGMPASGRRVAFRGITWIRIEGNKLLEGFDCWNQSGLLQALTAGVPPASVQFV